MRSRAGLPGTYTAHVGAHGRREQSWRGQVVDPLLPRITGLLCRVDVLDAAAVDLGDGVLDPSGLDLDTAGPVGQQRWAVRAVQVEHVGVAGDGGAQVGVCGGLPLVLEVGAVDALEAHVGHATSDLAQR